MKKVLGIDYGEKYIGIAIGDYEVKVATPCDDVSSFIELLTEIEKHKVAEIVLGLPIGLDRHDTPQTKEVRDFAKKLERASGLPVKLVDETYTSRAAGGDHGRAAALILQSHFDTSEASGDIDE